MIAGTVRETLERMNCDPIAGLIQIAQNERNESQIRAYCYTRLGRYIYADAAGDAAGGGGNTFVVNVNSIPAPRSAITVREVATKMIGGGNG